MRKVRETTNEEWTKENHDFIMDFLNQTNGNYEDVTMSVKATVCQFLQNVRHGLHLCTEKNGGQWVTRKQIIETQIEELRRCIIDLNRCLNNKEVKQ